MADSRLAALIEAPGGLEAVVGWLDGDGEVRAAVEAEGSEPAEVEARRAFVDGFARWLSGGSFRVE